MKLVELPQELFDVILSFLLSSSSAAAVFDDQFQFSQTLNTLHHQIIKERLTLETISKQFSERVKSSESFWWNLLEYEAKNCNIEDLNQRRTTILKNQGRVKNSGGFLLRRKVLLLRWARTRFLEQERQKQPSPSSTPTTQSHHDLRNVCVLGERGGGKSSIVHYFIYNQFKNDCYYEHCYDDTFRKQLNEKIMLEILDQTDTQEETSTPHRNIYLRRYTIYVFVFSTMIPLDEKTRYNVEERISFIVRERDCNTFPILFAINGIDLSEESRSQSSESIQLFIGSLIKEFQLRNTAIFETSAKNGYNISSIFQHVVKMDDYSKFPFLDLLEHVIKHDAKIPFQDIELLSSKKKCLLC